MKGIRIRYRRPLTLLLVLLLVLPLISGCSAKPKADKETDIGPDEKLTMNGVVFSIDKTEKLKEVKPAKPSGYYNYYEGKKGYMYLVVTGTAENKGQNSLDADNILVRGIRGHKEYEGKLLFSNKAESDLVKKLGKNEKQTFYFILLVKDKDALPDTIEVFYNHSFEKQDKKDKEKRYDEAVRQTLPSNE